MSDPPVQRSSSGSSSRAQANLHSTVTEVEEDMTCETSSSSTTTAAPSDSPEDKDSHRDSGIPGNAPTITTAVDSLNNAQVNDTSSVWSTESTLAGSFLSGRLSSRISSFSLPKSLKDVPRTSSGRAGVIVGIFFGVLGTAIAVTFGVAESTNSSAALAQSQLSYELDYRSYCEDHPSARSTPQCREILSRPLPKVSPRDMSLLMGNCTSSFTLKSAEIRNCGRYRLTSAMLLVYLAFTLPIVLRVIQAPVGRLIKQISTRICISLADRKTDDLPLSTRAASLYPLFAIAVCNFKDCIVHPLTIQKPQGTRQDNSAPSVLISPGQRNLSKSRGVRFADEIDVHPWRDSSDSEDEGDFYPCACGNSQCEEKELHNERVFREFASVCVQAQDLSGKSLSSTPSSITSRMPDVSETSGVEYRLDGSNSARWRSNSLRAKASPIPIIRNTSQTRSNSVVIADPEAAARMNLNGARAICEYFPPSVYSDSSSAGATVRAGTASDDFRQSSEELWSHTPNNYQGVESDDYYTVW